MTEPLRMPVRILDPELPLPEYATPGDAGLDLLAREGVVLKAGGGRARIPTGIALAIPEGWAGLVKGNVMFHVLREKLGAERFPKVMDGVLGRLRARFGDGPQRMTMIANLGAGRA